MNYSAKWDESERMNNVPFPDASSYEKFILSRIKRNFNTKFENQYYTDEGYYGSFEWCKYGLINCWYIACKPANVK